MPTLDEPDLPYGGEPPRTPGGDSAYRRLASVAAALTRADERGEPAVLRAPARAGEVLQVSALDLYAVLTVAATTKQFLHGERPIEHLIDAVNAAFFDD